MDNRWVFEEVTWKELEATLRSCCVPEDAIQDLKARGEAYRRKNIRLADSTDESEALISSVDKKDT